MTYHDPKALSNTVNSHAHRCSVTGAAEVIALTWHCKRLYLGSEIRTMCLDAQSVLDFCYASSLDRKRMLRRRTRPFAVTLVSVDCFGAAAPDCTRLARFLEALQRKERSCRTGSYNGNTVDVLSASCFKILFSDCRRQDACSGGACSLSLFGSRTFCSKSMHCPK